SRGRSQRKILEFYLQSHYATCHLLIEKNCYPFLEKIDVLAGYYRSTRRNLHQKKKNCHNDEDLPS
ncbi:hypothetical protein PENTCL1PPCAC_10932, partial [Pristionchus entomophagus]